MERQGGGGENGDSQLGQVDLFQKISDSIHEYLVTTFDSTIPEKSSFKISMNMTAMLLKSPSTFGSLWR
jgi:hypothetical protein